MPTRFSANPAVIMHRGVVLALVGAELARKNAGMQLRMEQLVRCFRLPDQQARGRRTNVRAIEVCPNATTQFCDVIRFPQARIGAGRTDLFTHRQGI